MQVAEIPRTESFLARYPRKLKLSLTVVYLLALVAPFILHGKAHRKTAPASVVEKSLSESPAEASPEKGGSSPPATTATQTTNATSPVLNGQDDHAVKLVPAPDPDLTEDTPDGSLPRISVDGREPWQYYARPFNLADTRPRVAIIITDMGLSRGITDTAIDRLPVGVTLAFDVQSPVTGAWLGRARQDGHEVLLQIPMEPFDYPRSDPGPNTLLTSLSNVDNIARLMWDLRQGSGYVGVMTVTGSRFTTTPEKLTPIMETLKQRGLMIVDTRIAPHGAITDLVPTVRVPSVKVTEWLDHDASPEAIDAALARLEKTARMNGSAVGITSPLPVVMDRLQNWFKGLPDRGVALAPISALAR